MAIYSLSIGQANQQYIQFRADFTDTPQNALIRLPRWRPGRYELGNFARNVKGFKVFDAAGKALAIRKEGSSAWRVDNPAGAALRVEYAYYAAELNAGSTFLSKDQLYANPVNCFVYLDDRLSDVCEVELHIPESWKIATSLQREGRRLTAPDFHELADAPFICAETLQYNQYECGGTIFHLWFSGDCIIDWPRIIKDFRAFTEKQIEKFIEFPVPHYHFLFHILPHRAYHGVEHQRSTVITLGPTYELFGELYDELLGISSHELYHTWNVKAIRPVEMFPYDYTQENFSRLGYLCEGVTTYMGDLMLFKSGVFSLKDYLRELTTQLQKHFDNFGRFNYSVADSSWDTWLDGYQPGAPGRKVSIYTEGCLLAFVCDVLIRKNTQNKLGLDEAMKRLYFNFALQGKGVGEEDYRSLLVELAGEEMNAIFDDYFYGTRPFEAILTDAFETIGLELLHAPSKRYSYGRLGFKTLPEGRNHIVKAIYPGSPADLGGLMLEDEIVAVNGFALHGELDKWLEYVDDRQKTLTVIRAGRLLELTLPEVQRHFYLDYGIRPVDEPNGHQKKAFEHWSK